MVNLFQYILPPVIGGIIGWSTNKLAIWMLFNPKTERRIFGLRIPFTPGLMPRDQTMIAKSLGTLVEERLLQPEEIESTITIEEINEKVNEILGKTIEKNIGKFVLLIPETAISQIKKLLASRISTFIKDELLNFMDIVNVKDIVEDKVSNFPLEELEAAIKSVTQKHLTYIALFGGFLGFIIGLVQIVLNAYL
ncbi:MAG: DUF445 family protein [Thermodesulfobacteriota bacterium]|nr:DUF445 family protein [Thermodesulfobacteriota bacterium]